MIILGFIRIYFFVFVVVCDTRIFFELVNLCAGRIIFILVEVHTRRKLFALVEVYINSLKLVYRSTLG